MVKTVKLHDLEFMPYLSAAELDKVVYELSEKINVKYQAKTPLFVVVLNGAFMFASDLFKKVTVDCEISFLRVSSYRGTASTGEVKELMPIGTDVSGRDIILVEDIVDTGKTMGEVKRKMKEAGANSVSICTLLYKPDAFQGDYLVDFVGVEIPDRFVVGYGLDYDGLGRNLPSLYQIKSNI
ncbi:MAG: hypoxanthine phosphoribosyltransferase [Bacteroidia bacterium]|jgi:hypoxanthine phosphoribosyltransferase